MIKDISSSQVLKIGNVADPVEVVELKRIDLGQPELKQEVSKGFFPSDNIDLTFPSWV